MTLDDIKAYPKETITADMAGAVLGFSGHAIRLAARDFPERLPRGRGAAARGLRGRDHGIRKGRDNNMEMSGKQFKRWRRERDAMIEKQDVDEFKRFYQKWRAFGIYDAPLPADRVIEIALRRMALECTRTSAETKLAAALWLIERGLKLPEGERENEHKHKQAGAEGEREAPGAEDGEGADVHEAGT